VAEYRAYVIGADGRFVNVRNFAASSDEEAIRRTQERYLDGQHKVELWQDANHVRTFDVPGRR
jgi:hypothetical protein